MTVESYRFLRMAGRVGRIEMPQLTIRSASDLFSQGLTINM